MADTKLNDFVASGTSTQRAAFTPSPPSPASGPASGYFWYETDTGDTYSWKASTSAWVKVNNSSGSVTTTGSPASGNLAKFSGTGSITSGDLSGDVTTSGTLVATIGAAKVTLAKIADAVASSKLLGSGASGSGSSYAELTLGTGLSMSGTTLNASAAGAWTQIASQTVSGSSVATVSFTSIPGTYNDLIVVARAKGAVSATAVNLHMQCNGDGTAIYDYEVLTGNSSVSVTQAVAQTSMRLAICSAASAVNSNRFGNAEIRILQYANTGVEKDAMSDSFDNDLHTASVSMRRASAGGTWRSTAAITRLDFLMDSGNIDVGSTFILYGRN